MPPYLSIATNFKLPYLPPLDPDDDDAPLDLSVKCWSSGPALSSNPPPPPPPQWVKDEPAALEAHVEAGASQAIRAEARSAKADTCTEESA